MALKLELSDAYQHASKLENALFELIKYYDQSKTGAKAKAVLDTMRAAFWDAEHTCWTRYLAAFDIQHVDTLQERAGRAEVWTQCLRPALAGATFIQTLRKTRVAVRHANVRVTLAQRDACIQVLEEAVPYWDVYFGVGGIHLHK